MLLFSWTKSAGSPDDVFLYKKNPIDTYRWDFRFGAVGGT